TRPRRASGSFRRASATISPERSTPTTSASGKRSAIANAPAPVPAPRSSARRGAWTVSSAATSGARLCSARIVSQRGARRSNSSSIGRRSKRQSAGQRTTSVVAIRAKRRPIASRTFTLEWRCTRPARPARQRRGSGAARDPPLLLRDRDGLLGAAAPGARADRRLELLLELARLRQLLRDVGAADQ